MFEELDKAIRIREWVCAIAVIFAIFFTAMVVTSGIKLHQGLERIQAHADEAQRISQEIRGIK